MIKTIRNHPRFEELFPVVALIAVSAVWGSTFVVMADAITRYPMYAFLAIRFFLATVVLVLVTPKALKKLNKDNLKLGLAASVFLTLGYILQTASLLPAAQGGTTPARSAFLTGMYVILVPLIQAVLRRKFPNKGVAAGVVLALGGLWALSGLSLSGGGLTHWVPGDTLVLLSAVAYSFHMTILGTTDKRHDARALVIIQMTVVTIITGICSFAVGEHAGIPQGWQIWLALFITSVLASSLAYTVQTWTQFKLPPARVALILVLEPAFGGAFGWFMAGKVIAREALGAVLLLAGMVSSEAIQSAPDTPASRQNT